MTAEELLVRGREDRVFIGRDERGQLKSRELTEHMRAALARYADPAVDRPRGGRWTSASLTSTQAIRVGRARAVRQPTRTPTGATLDRRHAYPTEFVRALTEAGWLAALIPTEYGGSGLGITEAALILEEVNRTGGNAGAAHAQMYIMGTLLRHGSSRPEAALPAARSRAASCACKPSA